MQGLSSSGGTQVAAAAPRQVSDMLRATEEEFRAIFELSAVGITEADPLTGRFVRVNRKFCEITGYTTEELLQMTFSDITHPEDRERDRLNFQSVLDGGRDEWEIEKRYLRKDNLVIWVRVTGSVLRDERGPFRSTAAVRDITRERETEQRLTLAQTAANLGYWDWDLRANVHTVFGGYSRLYGLPPDHPLPTYEAWLDAIHPDDRERVQTLVQEAMEQTHVWDAEFRVQWPDGSIHWMLGKGTVFLDDLGRPVRMAGVNLDITERKQAEAALRESELQYKEVFDNISECMFLVDVTSDGRFKFAGFNPAEEKAVGLSNAEVSGRFVEEVFEEELAKKVTGNYRRCLEADAPIEYDDELNLPGGRRYFHSNLIPMRNAAGRIHRIVGACMDLTEQKLGERALRQSLDEIAHLNRVAGMGELAASLAHQLNQPLAAILSNAQAASRFLNRESPDLAQARECLTAIAADDMLAGEAIKRLRTLLKKGEFQASLVDLNEVVNDALRLVVNDALLRQASVKFKPLPGLQPVRGDRIQLYQVVLNLTVNGLEAAELTAAGRWILVQTTETNGCVELTVEDSGKGIPESDLIHVFEPFFTTKSEGLGMGLSISRTIVQAHGGRIWAENSARGGAVFRCVLPVAQQAVPAAG